MKEFGEHLREIRLKKGLSQEELANIANIPIQQVGRIERSEVNTTLITIKAISDALEIDIKELFNFKK